MPGFLRREDDEAGAPAPPAEVEDPVVVVEQHESDEDTFETDSPGIIFVRRKRAKKPEPPPANTMSPEMQMLYASMFGSRSF